MPEYVLLVGSGDMRSHNQLGPNTLARLEAAYGLWREERYDWIVVSGAICHKPSIQTVAAAITMKERLIRFGVPEDKILVDEAAYDTYQNVIGCWRVLRENGIIDFRVTAVSQWQHVTRFYQAGRHLYEATIAMHPLPAPYSIGEALFCRYHEWDKQGNKPPARFIRWTRTFPQPVSAS